MLNNAPQVYIENLGQFIGQSVQLKGWVKGFRSSGKLGFLNFRDGTGFCQCVALKKVLGEEGFKKLKTLEQESCLGIWGEVKSEPRSPGGIELMVHSFSVLNSAKDYPITPKEHGVDFLLSHRHLWLRSSKQHAIMRVRHRLIKSMQDFFDSRQFVRVDAPIFTPSACEGTTTLFKTQYFDASVYLSQSGQLYNEASAAALSKVYSFGPTFRAEKSKTRKHLIEFWMIEPEVAFNDLEDNMQLAEQFVEYITHSVCEHSANELKLLERDTSLLLKTKAPMRRVHYKEASKVLLKQSPTFVAGGDFGAADEELLTRHFGDAMLFVHGFPSKIKAFYMKPEPDDPEYSLSCDLLAPHGGGEIIGGGQREDDFDSLKSRIIEHGLEEKDFAWYLDLRKYGSFVHSGFGLGVERMLRWICGAQHIRECIAYPRTYGRLSP